METLGHDSGKGAAKREFRGILLAEWGADLRAKSAHEHPYAGTAVGGFGAVVCGVAALRPEKCLGTDVESGVHYRWLGSIFNASGV